MLGFLGKRSAMLLVGTTLLLGGCATTEEVEHAQATADSAKSDAAAAMSAAQQANSAAQAADQHAGRVEASVAALSDKMESQRVHHLTRHHGINAYRHHHRRHRAAAAPATPPATPAQ